MCNDSILLVEDQNYVIRHVKAKDANQIRNLLQSSGLPVAGIDQHLENFIVADGGGFIIGVVGAHYDGEKALLRSFAVSVAQRNIGIGSSLMQQMIRKMKSRGIKEVYLLTETAARYFIRKGFVEISRDDIPRILLKESRLDQMCACSSQCLKCLL